MTDLSKPQGKMGIVLLLAALLFFACTFEASAAKKKTLWGLGPVAGETTGLSVKVFFAEQFAFHGTSGFSFWHRDHLMVFALDFIWYPMVVYKNPVFALAWYVGGGLGFGLKAPWSHPDSEQWDPAMWVRVPTGLSFLFLRVPIETFAEVGLSVRVYEPVDPGPMLTIGLRWFFS